MDEFGELDLSSNEQDIVHTADETLKARLPELGQAAKAMLWGDAKVPSLDLTKLLRSVTLTAETIESTLFNGTDALTRAYTTLMEFVDSCGIISGWKPSWDALRLAVRVCTVGKDEIRQYRIRGIRTQEIHKPGSVRYHVVTDLRLDTIAACSGIACGDVILQVNDRLVLGQRATFLDALLALQDDQVKIVVLPATVAQVLLPSMQHDDSIDNESTTRVVFGLISIASSSNSDNSQADAKKSRWGRSGRATHDTIDQTTVAQERRAKILKRAMELLSTCTSRFPAQEYFETFRPALVREYGEQIVASNEEFVYEIICSMSLNAAAPIIPKQPSPLRRTSSSEELRRAVERQASLEAAELAWQKEKLALEAVTNQPVYAYADEQDDLRQSALTAAEQAWSAEKKRRRALGPDTSQELVSFMAGFALHQPDEQSDASRGTLFENAQRNSRSEAANKKKLLAQRRQAAKKHAADALQAAEDAWEAEKARLSSKNIATSSMGTSSIHMKRGAGGRVAPRSRGVSEDSFDSSVGPEPNRPWFGRKS